MRQELTCIVSAQDYPYLSPIVKEIMAEQTEREDLESMVITKRKATEKKPQVSIESKH